MGAHANTTLRRGARKRCEACHYTKLAGFLETPFWSHTPTRGSRQCVRGPKHPLLAATMMSGWSR